jgi:ribonuclease P protein subunit POP4
MTITKANIHKHELIGLSAQIIASEDKNFIGISGKIIDETKNTFILDTKKVEKTIQKQGTKLALKIGDEHVKIDASKLRFRPEDRIKKARKKAVA